MPERSVVGTGLVTVDLVLDTEGTVLGTSTGGTCGNVLAILAWLGVRAHIVGRLPQGPDGLGVADELAAVGVDTRWLHLGAAAPTPMIIQRLVRDASGAAQHHYELRCPSCRSRLP